MKGENDFKTDEEYHMALFESVEKGDINRLKFLLTHMQTNIDVIVTFFSFFN